MVWLKSIDNNELRRCKICEKELEHNELAINEKLLGRGLVSFYCLDCLADYLDSTREDLERMTQEFILEGCLRFRKN